MRPGRHWRGCRDLVEASLEDVELGLAKRRAARDVQHWHAIEVGVGNGGVGVREPGPRGNRADSDASGRPSVGLGCVPRGALVPRVDQPDPVAGAGLQERIEVAAVQREDVAHSGRGERPGQQLPAVNLRHRVSPPSACSGPPRVSPHRIGSLFPSSRLKRRRGRTRRVLPRNGQDLGVCGGWGFTRPWPSVPGNTTSSVSRVQPPSR